MQILINRCTDATFNLALEELLSKNSKTADCIMFWRNANAVIVGCNQNSAAEINSDYVRQNNIQVVRRITGGGAVYHDLGNLNFTICLNDRLLSPEAFAENAAVIVQALNSFGVPAEFSGRNDILVNGRKISGSAKSVFRDRTLFHGTLLFDTDISKLTSALNPDEKKIIAKGIRSIRSRVANIREFLPDWDMEKFQSELIRAIGGTVSPISPELISAAEILADQKYRQWEWNYGSNFDYSYCKKERFSCGTVEIYLYITGNRIDQCRIHGDFFGTLPVEELARMLDGTTPNREAVAEKISAVKISDYIQGMSTEEFLTLFSF